MRIEDLPSDDEIQRRGYLAYVASRMVLGIRRDPSQRHPEDTEELAWYLLKIASQLVEHLSEELTSEDLLIIYPVMKGAWEADREIGVEAGVWGG